MKMTNAAKNLYLTEGSLINTPENRAIISSNIKLKDAMQRGTILEARAVVCDSNHNLIVDMPCIKGIIPRDDGAMGIKEGLTKDIALIAKVNKPVCFKVVAFDTDQNGEPIAILSRKRVQEECCAQYIKALRPGDVIPAKVTHMEKFGCFVDIGCGIPSLIPIDAISISRISHPSDRFTMGQSIKAVVKSIQPDPDGPTGLRIFLTHKELLGTWEENAQGFHCWETVAGVIRSVEQYGVFVELSPNLAGLADLKEALRDGIYNIRPGQLASVYIKSIIPEKMKIKLIIVEVQEPDGIWTPPQKLKYFTDEAHIDRWTYSTPQATKCNETIFSPSMAFPTDNTGSIKNSPSAFDFAPIL